MPCRVADIQVASAAATASLRGSNRPQSSMKTFPHCFSSACSAHRCHIEAERGMLCRILPPHSLRVYLWRWRTRRRGCQCWFVARIAATSRSKYGSSSDWDDASVELDEVVHELSSDSWLGLATGSSGAGGVAVARNGYGGSTACGIEAGTASTSWHVVRRCTTRLRLALGNSSAVAAHAMSEVTTYSM